MKHHLRGWKCYSKPRKENAKNSNPRGGMAILGSHNVKLKYSHRNKSCADIEIICCKT